MGYTALKRLLSLHPAMLLLQAITTFAVYRFGAAHLAGPGPVSAATIAFIVVRTIGLFLAFYGAIYLVFYVLPFTKRRLAPYKIIEQLPRTALVHQEIVRSLQSCLIAAGYEIAIYLAVATGHLKLVAPGLLGSIGIALIILVWTDVHFYATHRLMHTKWLYKRVHVVHHYSNNPNPFSSFSFHPIEGVAYFSAMLVVFLVPVSTFHVVFVMMALELLPAYGHLGFGKETSGSYFHFLHHRKNATNFGASIIWDKLFGTYEAA